MSCSPDEAVEKSVSGGLRRRPCRRRFADHAQPLNETDENSGGTCRLNAIGQLARNLRPGKGISHPRLHDFEKAPRCDDRLQHPGQPVPWLWPPAGIRAGPWRRSCAQRSRQGRPAGRRPALCGGQVRHPSVSGHRQCSDQAHAKRASACHRKRRKGCHARVSSHEEGPGAPWRDNRATRTRPSRVRQRLPRRNFGGGHGATALGFGGSLPIYRPIGL